jgi:hypothetical protein
MFVVLIHLHLTFKNNNGSRSLKTFPKEARFRNTDWARNDPAQNAQAKNDQAWNDQA